MLVLPRQHSTFRVQHILVRLETPTHCLNAPQPIYSTYCDHPASTPTHLERRRIVAVSILRPVLCIAHGPLSSTTGEHPAIGVHGHGPRSHHHSSSTRHCCSSSQTRSRAARCRRSTAAVCSRSSCCCHHRGWRYTRVSTAAATAVGQVTGWPTIAPSRPQLLLVAGSGVRATAGRGVPGLAASILLRQHLLLLLAAAGSSAATCTCPAMHLARRLHLAHHAVLWRVLVVCGFRGRPLGCTTIWPSLPFE